MRNISCGITNIGRSRKPREGRLRVSAARPGWPRDSRQDAGATRFVGGHRKQDSANQLNPGFVWGLEVNHDAGRDADIVLREGEQVAVKIVGLQAPGDERNEVIVDSASDAAGYGGVASETVGAGVRESHQAFGERTNLADGDGDARAEQEIVDMHVRIGGTWPAGDNSDGTKNDNGELLLPVVRAEVGHHAYPRNDLSFDRSFKAVQAAPRGRQLGVVVGISDENIARGGNLSRCERSKRNEYE